LVGRALSNDEIKQVLYEAKKKEIHAPVWPTNDELKTLAQAVTDKLPYVTLNRMRFSIRYTTHFGNAVFIRPADTTSFVPCGYFSTSRLRELLV